MLDIMGHFTDLWDLWDLGTPGKTVIINSRCFTEAFNVIFGDCFIVDQLVSASAWRVNNVHHTHYKRTFALHRRTDKYETAFGSVNTWRDKSIWAVRDACPAPPHPYL